MQDFIDQLTISIRDKKPVVYTALVETRGSTPQKAGATMLVFPDGSQAGTLGGGCVEAEVKRRALRVLKEKGPREIMSFQLDNDYGWDDGLICGGRMKMLVDPIQPEQDDNYFSAFIEALADGRGCTEAIVIDPAEHAANRFLIDSTGTIIASRGSGNATDTLTENLRPLASRPRPYVENGVSYLPYLKRCRLLIVGAGHVGEKVAELAHEVGFDVCVVDDRAKYCNADRFPHAKKLIVGAIAPALQNMPIDPDTLCIIVTRGHNHDEEALFHLAETDARYVGMIGSRRKIRLIFEDLLREGISEAALRRVHAPLGFEIGSQTVPEIAVSIVAELVACRNLSEIPAAYQRVSLMDSIPAS